MTHEDIRLKISQIPQGKYRMAHSWEQEARGEKQEVRRVAPSESLEFWRGMTVQLYSVVNGINTTELCTGTVLQCEHHDEFTVTF